MAGRLVQHVRRRLEPLEPLEELAWREHKSTITKDHLFLLRKI